MSDLELGWGWFETKPPSNDSDKWGADRDLAEVFARCFRGEEGKIVLNYLRSMTQSRALGPAASDALLRHMEGQRQLVAQVLSLVEQGRGPRQASYEHPTHNTSAIMENTDD